MGIIDNHGYGHQKLICHNTIAIETKVTKQQFLLTWHILREMRGEKISVLLASTVNKIGS